MPCGVRGMFLVLASLLAMPVVADTVGDPFARMQLLEKKAIVEVIRVQVWPKLDVCHERLRSVGHGVARLMIGPDGVVQSVEISGEMAATAIASCIEDAFAAARFPAFEGRAQAHLQRFVLGSPMPDDRSTPLGKQTIVNVMRSEVSSKVRACYDRYGKPGTAHMRFVVASDGVVKSAEDIGELRGTLTASCIAEAVLAARFPPFVGASQTVVYPFVLR